MNNTWLRLHANCVAVRGFKNAIICDLQRQRYRIVPLSLIDAIEQLSLKPIALVRETVSTDDIPIFDEYIQFLTSEGFAFECSEDLAKQLPRMQFESSCRPQPKISNAIIDVAKSSRHDFAAILDQLAQLGCAHIEVRCFEPLNSIGLIEDISRLCETSAFRTTNFVVKYECDVSEQQFANLLRRFPRIHQIIIHSANESRLVKEVHGMSLLIFTNVEVKSNAHCGAVSPFYFAVNFEAFSNAAHRNSCLDRKVSIDVNGDIKNCPSMPNSFGNIKNCTLAEVVCQSDFVEIWKTTKDQIDVCRDCEFRYICPDCRVYISNPDNPLSKPAKCRYDPYKGEWIAPPSDGSRSLSN